MLRLNGLRVLLRTLAAIGALLTTASASAACADLLALSLPSTTISSATDVPAGAFTAPDGTVLDALPAFCRVVGVSRPASDSEIGFEVWIPSAGWNQNYLQVGTVVFAGNIQYRSLGFALRRGYATATTDGGHRASIGDASFARGHPQKILDWGYQALATTISNGKALVSAYTHRAPHYSYFFGASNGGRDALIAAQRFPGAFDGIIADAPSSAWVHNAFSWLWSQDAQFGSPAATISAAKLPAIQAAALAQCDAKDHTADGVVNDPRRCRFDPRVLLCSGAESDACLTAPQLQTLAAILAGPVNPRTGERIYYGFEPFAVATPGTWNQWITGNAAVPGGGHAVLANQFFANMVFDTGSAGFDHTQVNFDTDVARAERKPVAGQPLASVIDATSADLSGFRARNGKMIPEYRLGRSGGSAARRDHLLRIGRGQAMAGQPADQQGRGCACADPAVLPPVHGARHGPLHRRTRHVGLRRAVWAARIGHRSPARRVGGDGGVGRARHRPGTHRRGKIRQ